MRQQRCGFRALERLDAPARKLEMPPPFALLARFQDEQPVLVVADYKEGAQPTPDALPRQRARRHGLLVLRRGWQSAADSAEAPEPFMGTPAGEDKVAQGRREERTASELLADATRPSSRSSLLALLKHWQQLPIVRA